MSEQPPEPDPAAVIREAIETGHSLAVTNGFHAGPATECEVDGPLLAALDSLEAERDFIESHFRTVLLRHHSGKVDDGCAYNMREVLAKGEERS